MNKLIIAICVVVIFAVRLDAIEMLIPAGTTVEGVVTNGIYAEEGTPVPFFTIKAIRNPVAVGGNEIPVKDCLVMGDIVADLTLKRAFFNINKIMCSNAKEPNGIRITGYAIDSDDNKLGIKGKLFSPKKKAVPQPPPPQPAVVEEQPVFLEIAPDKKVFLVIVEGVSITIK